MKKVRYKRELTHDEKVEMVVFFIILLSTLPVFIGFGAFEIIDHFNVKELKEAGDPMALVWTLAGLVFTVIGIMFTGYLILYILRHWPRMREAFPALWEDEDGNPAPENIPKFLDQEAERKPVPPKWKEWGERFTRGYVCFVMVIIGWLGGVVTTSSWDRIQEWLGITPEDIAEKTMLYYKGEFYDAIIIIITFACMMYAMHRMVTSKAMTPLKQFIPDPIDRTGYISSTAREEYDDDTDNETSSDQGVEKK